jgi:hypothetical protein
VSNYVSRFNALKARFSERDQRMRDVTLIRTGNADQVFKGLLPAGNWSKPIVANMINIAAEDLAEQTGVLPTVTAAGDSVLDESSRTKADKRTKILNYYVAESRLGTEMVRGADQYHTFGFTVFRVEPNFKKNCVHIQIENGFGSYFDVDRFGDTQMYARLYRRKAGELAAMFPEHADLILKPNAFGQKIDDSAMLQVVRMMDKQESVLFVLDRDGLVLERVANMIPGVVPVTVAVRPSIDGDPRGQFDDVLPIYAAKARMAYLTMDAVQKSVDAPLALPNDVTQLSIGGDAVIRSNSPEKIRRVPLEAPPMAFAQNNTLNDEMRIGARFPQARTGELDNSIVTGQGVKALMAGFDGQIKTAQSVIGEALGRALSIALQMDEAVFGEMQREVSAYSNGIQFKLKYKPSVDIAGNYGVNVEYGLMAGMDPNRSLVWALQARGDKLISRSLTRRNLPVSINASEEERAIDIEDMRDSLKQSVAALASAIPQMVSQGQDPMKIVASLATVIDERRKGTPIEDAVAKAFKPEEPEPQPQPEAAPQDMLGAMMGGGVEPQAEQGINMEAMQGPPPPMATLLAGLNSSGNPIMSGRVSRSMPI